MADVAIDTDVASRLQKGTEPAWVRGHVLPATLDEDGCDAHYE